MCKLVPFRCTPLFNEKKKNLKITFKYLKFVWSKNKIWRSIFFIFLFPKVLQKFAFKKNLNM
jgi:hypothetical protein